MSPIIGGFTVKIGLIDVDGHNFPNLPLMKLSAYHKACGDTVEWYQPLFSGHLDRVYVSKVFSFTPDYEYFIDADEVIKGGSGYAIEVVDGKEVYHSDRDMCLPEEVEHMFPDYGIYPTLTENSAYGYLTRGCPRGCGFCHVASKEGRRSHKVADLSEFWNGQKKIVLLDPNITACKDFEELGGALTDSGAWVDFTQGIDIRTMTEEKARILKGIKVKNIHFAWDRYEDKEQIVPKFKMFSEITGWRKDKMSVYVLVNYDTTFEQDLERVYTLRDLGYHPDVRIYRKDSLPKFHKLIKMQRWVNAPMIFYKVPKFEDYDRL